MKKYFFVFGSFLHFILGKVLDDRSRRVGLGINLDKNKVMFNEHIIPEQISVKDVALKVVQEYVYLGQTMHLGRYNFEGEIVRRVQPGWTAFGKLRHIKVTKPKDQNVQAIEVATHLPEHVSNILNNSRRILSGDIVTENRPYMVQFKLPRNNPKMQSYRKWLCGGVIIHEEYVLTSAACIQDVEHFYIVSGTYKYSDDEDRFNNPCIKNGAKKAIWKCIPKNYVFDGHENDNIRWMNNDIAVVKIEDGFDFARRVRGCEFVPKPICYNNQSLTLENKGTIASIAGWGTTERYNDWVNRRSGRKSERDNQQILLDTTVEIIGKNRCKRRWGPRYANIIENYMICTKDIGQTMSEICNEKYVDCQDINYSDEEETRRDANVMRSEKIPTNLVMHSAWHNETYANGTRRLKAGDMVDGGFCENDHGGPLVYGTGINSVVIGIISACLVKERTNKCYGPFLYTSVYKNRQLISCSIYKDVESKCRRQFRSGITHEETFLSWKHHEDGPAKYELAQSQLPPPKKVLPIIPQMPIQARAQSEVAPVDASPAQPVPQPVDPQSLRSGPQAHVFTPQTWPLSSPTEPASLELTSVTNHKNTT